MPNEPLALAFLGVIALASLLQAGFVVAFALGVRTGGRKVADVESRLSSDVLPRLTQAARAAETAADLSARAVVQARRVDAAVSDASLRLLGAVDRTSERVERFAEGATDRLVGGVRRRAAATSVGRTVARAAAVAHGVQRAVDAWEQAGDDERAHPNGDEGEPEPEVVG